MCRLAAITSKDYFSPIDNIVALEAMKEGYDGSGMGVLLKNLGGELEEFKEYPILSGICTKDGIKKLDEYMDQQGFKLIYQWSPKIKPVAGVQPRDYYFGRIYDYPEEYKDKPWQAKEELLLRTRLTLRRMGEADESIIVFSFWPDVLMIKEVGDPVALGEFFGFDNSNLKAKIIFAQGRQNTNYDINLYACHPFFIQGYGSMTNGENTAFVPIKEFLMSRGFPGYIGYQSDSEVFTHILHYICKRLGLPLHYYKDVITPMKDSEIEQRPDRDLVRMLKVTLRPLCIDGPNCVIGVTPDGTTFMAQDSKKLRPGAVGGVKGRVGLMSEVCGLDNAVPDRDTSKDVFPMKYDMVIVSPDAQEVKVWNQRYGWTTIIN